MLGLSKKGDIGVELKAAYDAGNREELQEIARQVIPEVTGRVKELHAAHRRQWLSLNKPFGWEVIDIRYGGLLQRLDTARLRIEEYVRGDLEAIDELEQKRLYFSPNVEESSGLGWCSYYYRMASLTYSFMYCRFIKEDASWINGIQKYLSAAMEKRIRHVFIG